jgi:multimeric flavodoxin WrbA
VKILAINGSERVSGATSDILRYIQKILQERGADYKLVHLAENPPVLCGPCGDCNTRLIECDIEDSVKSIVDLMVESDAIIYATPVHGFGTAGLMQAFIERAGVGYLRFKRPLRNKVAGVVVVGRRYSHSAVVEQLYNNILLNRMIIATDGFPSTILMEGKRSPFEDAEGMATIDRMIDRVLELVSLICRADRPSWKEQAEGEQIVCRTEALADRTTLHVKPSKAE